MKKQSPDFSLMSVILILIGMGLVCVYSSSAIYALDKYGASTYFLWRELMWISLGFMGCFVLLLYDYRKLKSWVKPLLLVTVILLVLVPIFGKEVHGAKRWLRIGGIGLQPSELAKLALILFVADYCDRRRSRMENLKKGLLPLFAVLGFVCGLIFLQKDLGTPLLIMMTCMMIIFVGGGKKRHLAWLFIGAVILGSLAIWAEPYRRKRMLAFLDPIENARGTGYQLYQSLIALGSGGLTGSGLGNSHSKLLYLPEPHTDFVFPIFGEEFGLVGTWGLLTLFGLLAWMGFRVASRTTNFFGRLLAAGITISILFQAIFNIGVVTGCLPTKGLPLPFLSFGGSSMVVTLAAIGILLNISRDSGPVEPPKAKNPVRF